MTTLTSRFSVPALTTAGVAVAAPTLASAHETGVPHGVGEHLMLYVGAAAVLAVLGFVVAFCTKRPETRRVRVERDENSARRRR